MTYFTLCSHFRWMEPRISALHEYHLHIPTYSTYTVLRLYGAHRCSYKVEISLVQWYTAPKPSQPASSIGDSYYSACTVHHTCRWQIFASGWRDFLPEPEQSLPDQMDAKRGLLYISYFMYFPPMLVKFRLIGLELHLPGFMCFQINLFLGL